MDQEYLDESAVDQIYMNDLGAEQESAEKELLQVLKNPMGWV
jgi:hypothetical protein